jgi:hypothetical protein
MPKEKNYTSLIARIYKRNYEDIGMFFFIEGQRQLVPAMTVEQAIYNYFRLMCIRDFNYESASTTYFRMKKEYYEAAKQDK